MESRFVTGRPGPVLRGHVRAYTGYAERSAAPVRRRELPSPAASLIISLGPRITVVGQGERTSFVAGVDDAAAETEFAGEQLGVQVDLAPPAAARLLGVPMCEVGRPVVALEDVLGRAAGELVERLADRPAWGERFALLDDALARRFAAGAPTPPEVLWAWGRLCATGGRATVRDLAAELGWSERRLLRAFRRHVGLGPQAYGRVLRFSRAAERLRRDGDAALAQVALDCGYYDQAHFTRDFRALAGTTPAAFARGDRSVQDGAPAAA